MMEIAESIPVAEWRLIEDIRFGEGATDTNLGIGWNAVGGEFRWLGDQTSEVWIEHPAPNQQLILELDMQATEASS